MTVFISIMKERDRRIVLLYARTTTAMHRQLAIQGESLFFSFRTEFHHSETNDANYYELSNIQDNNES